MYNSLWIIVTLLEGLTIKKSGSGGESDHDSTTVSYSLDEDNRRDVDEEVEFRQEQPEDNLDGDNFPPEGQSDGAAPHYEDIVHANMSTQGSVGSYTYCHSSRDGTGALRGNPQYAESERITASPDADIREQLQRERQQQE